MSNVTIQGKRASDRSKTQELKASDDGTLYMHDVGLPNQRHNRTNNVITATWPGNDTFSVSWLQVENVRRYRVLVTGGADGDHVRVVEDAANEAQAESWLTASLNSTSSDVAYLIVHTSTPDANGTFIPHWSEWQELSKDPTDLSLSRLDFIASAAGPFTITVEAE